MGLVLFLLLTAAEIALIVRTCRRDRGERARRRDRLLVRAAELLIVLIALLLPFGQRWRLVPALGALGVLLVIAALKLLSARKRPDGETKKGAAAANGVLSVVFLTLLLIPAFVFTGYNGLPVTGGYEVAQTSAILIDDSRPDPFETDGSAREVPVHFYYPADGEGTFPLVLFSHGAFGYYQSNTSTYMELASHGYVVAALDHPHHAFFTRDSDGGTVLVDQDFLNTALTLSSDMDAERQLALYRDWMALRTADMGFALDTIKAAAAADSLDGRWFLPEGESAVLAALGMTDTSRIGLMGHSMGGATSVSLGRTRDDISAVADLDGTMLSEYTGVADGELLVREEPYAVPVLDFNNWDSARDLAEYRAQGGRDPNYVLLQHADRGYSVAIRDTKHMDFTDLPLLSPALGDLLGSGERDTAEAMTIVNSLVLGFFDCYLKGEGAFTVQDVY